MPDKISKSAESSVMKPSHRPPRPYNAPPLYSTRKLEYGDTQRERERERPQKQQNSARWIAEKLQREKDL